MSNMTKLQIKSLRLLIETTLTDTLKEKGFRFELGNASYDSDSVKFTGFRISFADALTQEEKALEQMLTMRRQASWEKTLDGNKIGYDRGVGYLLVGYKPRARKKPWLIESVEDGGQYVAPNSMIERMFGEEE
mgnify:CR=1 FL=1